MASKKTPTTSHSQAPSYAPDTFDDVSGTRPADDFVVSRHRCEFRPKLDTDSSATWTVIPTEAGQRFQGKLDSWKR